MTAITACPLPPEAFLDRYRRSGDYTDCYATEIERPVSHAQYVTAFYTTFLFRLERLILKWAVDRPSTDAQARQLAEGAIDSFAAWRVEDRAANQLLLSDYAGRTRSWLMAVPLQEDGGARMRLYFGSAVVAKRRTDGGRTLGFNFNVLLGFHKLYSRALLRSARKRLERSDDAAAAVDSP